MRAWELLESDNSDFESDLEDLLVAAKANDIIDIEVDDLVDQLSAMGHSVTPDSLASALQNRDDEFVKNVTVNTITLKSHTVDDDMKSDYEDEEVDAEKLASKTAMKGVKKKQKQHRDIAKDAQL